MMALGPSLMMKNKYPASGINRLPGTAVYSTSRRVGCPDKAHKLSCTAFARRTLALLGSLLVWHVKVHRRQMRSFTSDINQSPNMLAEDLIVAHLRVAM